MCVIFWFFAVQACKFTPPINNEPITDISWILGLAAAGSCMGFLLLTAQHEGPGHYIGAGFFIFLYIMMQIVFYKAIDRVHKANIWERILEFGLPIISILCALLFLVFLVAGVAYKSYSALFEYGVFVTFLGINAYGVSMMVYICKWYYPVQVIIGTRTIIRWMRYQVDPATKQPNPMLSPYAYDVPLDSMGVPNGRPWIPRYEVISIVPSPSDDTFPPDPSPPQNQVPHPGYPPPLPVWPREFQFPPRHPIPPPPRPPHGHPTREKLQLVIPF